MKRLRLVSLITYMILILITGVSLTGILIPEKIYPEPEVVISFVPMDIVNLAMALPLMLFSIYLVHKKKLIGLLSLPGILFYLVYVYMGYLIGLEMNMLFIPYLVMVILSIAVTVLLLLQLNGHQVRSKLHSKVPIRTSGWMIVVIAVAILVYQFWSIFNSISYQLPVDRITLAQWIDDLAIGTPVLFLTGIHMIRRSPFGYVSGTGVLLLLSMLFIGLIPVLIAEGVLSGTPVKIVDLLIIAISSLICIIPLGLFVRGVQN